jgi:hypothetical protein
MATAKKMAYIGVELDDFESQNPNARTSQHSRWSDISFLKFRAQQQTFRHTSSALRTVRGIFAIDFWKQVPIQIKSFFQEGIADLRSIRWRHFGHRHLTVLGPIVFLIALIVILRVITYSGLYTVQGACQPDSGFRVSYGTYNIWDLSGFFQITLGFGSLPFTTVKIINVGWDVSSFPTNIRCSTDSPGQIIVGRGGQALLVIISYIVYSKALVRSMESSPVSYGTFEAITLQNGTLTANLKLTRDLLKNKTARARVLVVWLVTSGIFVLGFQTMVSAMSGYTANIQSFVEVDTGNLVRYSGFSLVRYVVHDAHRINSTLEKDFKVTTTTPDYVGEIAHLSDYGSSDGCIGAYAPALTEYNESSAEMDWTVSITNPMCDFYWVSDPILQPSLVIPISRVPCAPDHFASGLDPSYPGQE